MSRMPMSRAVVAVSFVLGIGAPEIAHATTATVPGNFTANTGGCNNGTGCFSVTDTSTADATSYAIVGNGTGEFANGIEGTSTNNVGVVGTSSVDIGVYGNAPMYGVYGLASASNGAGAVGSNSSGTGVLGESSNGYGVQALSVYGPALFAQNTSGDNDAVQGITAANCCSGGYFANTGSGNGVYVTGTNSGIAVHGVNVGGWAGYFEGNVYATGTYTSSDARLKNNIKDGRYGLGELLRLRPVTFTWKNDEGRKTQLGLIAQEVSKVVPEVVVADHSGMLSVNYTALVPVMVKAIQEQQKLIQEQEKLARLQEDRIATLERERSPITSSMFPSGGAGALLLGMLPLGLFVAFRRRKR